MFKQYSGLPRSVYIIALANVIMASGSFVWPLMTLFLTDKLNYSKDYAGFIIMLSTLLYVPGSLIGGQLADRFGRKAVLIICNCLAALSLLLCARFFGPATFIPLILSATFWQAMARPATSAILADVTNNTNRQAAYSLTYLSFNFGIAFGPAIAGFLYRDHLPILFLANALVELAYVALLAAFVKDTQPETLNEQVLNKNEVPIEGNVISALLQRPVLLTFALIQL